MKHIRQMAPLSTQVAHGKFDTLSSKVQDFVTSKAQLCQPANIHICDGSEKEAQMLADLLVQNGTAHKLEKLDNW